MALKRPFGTEILSEVSNDTSFKHQRLENINQMSLKYLDDSSVDGAQRCYTFGDDRTRKEECDAEQNAVIGQLPDYWGYIKEETASVLPRSLSSSPSAAQSPSDDEDIADVPKHLPLIPECFSFDRPMRPIVHVEDTYHFLLESPPRKRVPVGPEHQAEIPHLLPQRKGDFHDNDYIRCGTCVVHFPEVELPSYNRGKVGAGRSDCSCWDQGSFRCVRQHIKEARQKLRSSLGPVAFSELGFHDMGEVVAERWSEDDRRLFHKVVLSNPASWGRIFWNALSYVFPLQTKMELVSYYFNVFMLRKRAEQNRVDPMHIDSDNDEWQGSEEDDDDDEGGVTEDDEDSMVASPVSHRGPLHYTNCFPENDEDVDEVCDEEGNNPVLVPRKEFTSTGDVDLVLQPLGKKTCYDEAAENETQDGSCISSDSSALSQEGLGNSDSCDRWDEFILEPCDSYLSCPKNKVDLLPTCSVIKEVFGDGAFDLQGKRW